MLSNVLIQHIHVREYMFDQMSGISLTRGLPVFQDVVCTRKANFHGNTSQEEQHEPKQI